MAFEIKNCVLVKYREENGVTEVVIPDSVTTIDSFAFLGCRNLTSVTIPDSVTNIGRGAFSGCWSLTSVTIPNSVTSIGGSAFSNCKSLTSVTIPDSVTEIGDKAFYECKSLKSVTIPDSVTTIGDKAFWGCKSLKSVTIPDSVTEIGDSAFADCNALTNVVIPKSVKKLGKEAFPKKFMPKKKQSAKNQKKPRFEIEDDCLFTYNEPDEQEFEDELEGYDFDEYLQEECGGMGAPYPSWSKVRIPKGITTIGSESFGECWSVATITIPEGVTAIEDYAFYNCFNLDRITIPESVEEIGSMIFDECYNLRSISFVKNGKKVKFAFDYSEYDELEGIECETQMNLLMQFITAKTKTECEKIISQITIDRVKDEFIKILQKSFGE